MAKLGKYILQCDLRNNNNALTEDAVVGLSTAKQIIETKANMDGVNVVNYKLLPPKHFGYVQDTSRRGDKMALGYNDSEKTFLISSIYTSFYISKPDELDSDYLFMYFNRPEFDRYSRFNSWGSVRETFSWDDMCDIEINPPDIDTQRHFVSVYKAILTNQRAYEKGLEDLKLTCDAYIDQFKKTTPRVAIGDLLKEIDNRNRSESITNVQGININKIFMNSVANLDDTDLSKYKVISKGQFAYSAMQTGRDECIRIALYSEKEPCVISPAYSVLEVKNENVLSEFLMLWFMRNESDRYGWFISDSSIRASLELQRFYEIQIPIPPIATQQSIVDIYTAYIKRREINERLKKQIKDICPILIRGSIKN